MDVIGLLYSMSSQKAAWAPVEACSLDRQKRNSSMLGDPAAEGIIVPEMITDMKAVLESRMEASGQLMSHLTLD